MLREHARVGMKIIFGRESGEKTPGTIIKLNPTKAKVQIDEDRGSRSIAGEVWSVPYSMMTPIDVPVVARPQRIVYNRFADFDNLILEAMGHIYADLSPENLACDGERPYNEIVRVSRELNKKLQGLFQVYGRSVSEEEVFDWERQRRVENHQS